jgi:anti-sigma factor RsiW
MTMISTRAERHGTDGELIGILDGEADAARSVGAHVDTCVACSARLAVLQHRADRLSEVLAMNEPPTVERARLFPAPDRIAEAYRRARRRPLWSRPGMRAAAGILLLAGVAAASPARGWVLDRVPWRRAEPAREPGVADRTTAPAPRQVAGSIVRFAHDSDELVIRFAVRPAAGTLTLLVGDDLRSSAQIVSGADGEAFLVLPSELRIRNAAASLASYEVMLSPTLRRVRVELGVNRAQEIASVNVMAGMRHVIRLGSREGGR